MVAIRRSLHRRGKNRPRKWRSQLTGFRETLREQRWDDHRYYHHSRVNQSLHLVSATSFVCAYASILWAPWLAGLIGWIISMTTRQIGHFFFEPKGYDTVNQATHEYKEEIKVGYNLRRKAGLMAVWAASPLLLYFEPTLFGLVRPYDGAAEFIHYIGQLWLLIGISGLIFRSVQLFFIRDVRTGLVWATKILTDPFNDIKLYHKAPLHLLHREMMDPVAADHHG
jgi:hypothetical protein